jgi:hypothetical protein
MMLDFLFHCRAYIFFLLAGQWLEFVPDWREASAGAYNIVQLPLIIFQGLAILEIIHPIIGLVRASVMTTAIQVASRILLVVVSFLVPEVRFAFHSPIVLPPS